MLITRKSILSGVEHTIDLPVTQAQIDAWKNGELIQNAMPQLSKDEREFVKNGITVEEWNDMCAEESE